MKHSVTTTGLYVYAIIPAEGIAANELPKGIDGHALQIVSTHGLAAIVHEAAPEPYQGPDSEVKRWILQHSDVVDAVWEKLGTVLPMTFNVIVAPDTTTEQSPEQRLQTWLSDSAEPIRTQLDTLRDRVELRVDISLHEETATTQDPELVELRAGIDSRPAGVQRLYRKRLEERTRNVAERIADDLYPQFRKRLIALAEDLAENPRPARQQGSVTVLNASLLVHRQAVEAVGLELADIRDHQPGAQIRFLGPWPPYSFSELPSFEE